MEKLTAAQAAQQLRDRFPQISGSVRDEIEAMFQAIESAAEDRGYVRGKGNMGKRLPSNVR